MGITITVDLGTSASSDIVRAAKFMLEFAGYQASPVDKPVDNSVDKPVDTTPQVPSAPLGSLGEEIHGEELGDVQAAFVQPGTRVDAALPPPPPGIDVDSQGIPWDQRIHAGSRAKLTDGTWRQRRNLDPEVLQAVMAELRATMGIERRAPQPPAPPVAAAVFAPVPPVPPVPANVEVPPVPFAGSAVPPAPPTSGTPSVPVSDGAALAASPSSAPKFPQLMQKITAAFTQKKLTQADIQSAVTKVGLTSLPMLASRPDLVTDVATELGLAL